MFLSIYYVAATILSTWQVLTHLNLKNNSTGRYVINPELWEVN